MLEFLRGKFTYKIAALLLAVATYLYVRSEINGKGMGIREQGLLNNITSKVIPISVEFKGVPPPGYQVLKANVKVKPEKVIVLGKQDDLKKVSEIKTEAIDVSKFTHTQLLYVELVSVNNAINVNTKVIEVEIPIIALK